MDTLKVKQTKLIVLKYLLQLIVMGVFFFLLLITTTHFLNNVVKNMSDIPYSPSPSFNRDITVMISIYVLFSYFANNFILDLFHREKIPQLLISLLADLLIIPFEVWVMVKINNHTVKYQFADIMSVYNIYLITFLFIIKNMIAVRILSRQAARQGIGSIKTKH